MEVGSLERARWFWVEAIGLAVLEDRGPYIRVGGNGGFAIGIEQSPSGKPSSESPEIVVRVDDVDSAVARLQGLGVEVGPAQDQPWGWRHVWLKDPDGRPVSIYSVTR